MWSIVDAFKNFTRETHVQKNGSKEELCATVENEKKERKGAMAAATPYTEHARLGYIIAS